MRYRHLLFIFNFSIQYLLQLIVGFELWISGVGSDYPTHCATTTARLFNFKPVAGLKINIV